MIKHTRLFAAACTAIVLCATPAFPQNIAVTHAKGTSDVPANPATVVTYDLATLDTLDALGIEVTGVPESNMPPNLDAYESDAYEKVGSLFEPDFEAINALSPDLVIVAGRSSGAYENLANIAPTIDLTNDWKDFVTSVKNNSLILGEIFGKTDQINAMITDFDAKVTEFQSAADALGNALIILTSGGEITAYGPGSRFGLIHDTLGVKPAIADVEAATHGDAISFEFLLETNPDWLIVLDRDAAIGRGSDGAKQVLDNELVHQTTAWKNEQIIYLESSRWYVTNGGIANLNIMVDELGAAMLSDNQ